MSDKSDTGGRAEVVERRLAVLAERPVEVPSADAVYWRAQARSTLRKVERRRQVSLRPLRRFQKALGTGSVAAGVGAALWPLVVTGPGDAALVVAPLVLLLTTVGAALLAE